MNWQVVAKILCNIFAYAEVQIVVYTFERNGIHELSVEDDAEFYVDDQIERYNEEFFLENRELETDFLKILNPVNRHGTRISQSFEEKITTTDSLITIFIISRRN